MDFAISMRPDYHQAIIDTIQFYGWRKIIYLYDSHDGEYNKKIITKRYEIEHNFIRKQKQCYILLDTSISEIFSGI